MELFYNRLIHRFTHYANSSLHWVKTETKKKKVKEKTASLVGQSYNRDHNIGAALLFMRVMEREAAHI